MSLRARGPLTAAVALVAALAIATPASGSSCSTALDAGGAYRPGTHRVVAPVPFPVAHSSTVAVVSPLVSTILAELGKGALGAVGAHATGRLLESVGLGSSTAAQLSKIEAQLEQISNRLIVLQAALEELQKAGAHATFTNLVTQAVPTISAIKHVRLEIKALDEFHTTAGRKAQGREILEYICSHLLDKQTELNERIVGTGTGADNIITASSKLMHHSTRYWTEHQTNQLRQILEYYTLYEALLLELRVEWWHAIGKERSYVTHQIAHVKQQIVHQEALLKPGPGFRHIVDTKHPGLLWWPLRMADSYRYWESDARAEFDRAHAAAGGDWDKLGLISYIWTDLGWYQSSSRAGTSYLWPLRYNGHVFWYSKYFESAYHYRMPSADEVGKLFAGSHGHPLAYLRANGITWPFGAYRGVGHGLHAEVIWTSHYRTGFNLQNGHLRFNEWAAAPWGVIAVKPVEGHHYWY